MKSLTYYFHIKANIMSDFQICISVPLRPERKKNDSSRLILIILNSVKIHAQSLLVLASEIFKVKNEIVPPLVE